MYETGFQQNRSSMLKSCLRVAAVVLILIVFVAAWMSVSQRSEDGLVVYCAHDLIFAEQILEDFEAETGIKVVVVGDTEATKSLGLVQRLLREINNPKCDVFWNNQVLGTMELANAGVLQPYKGSGFERIPDQFKDAEGLWTGFAGRLRVWIINTELMSVDKAGVAPHIASGDLSRMAIANPMYGTTLSHFSLLWNELEEEGMKKWYEDLKHRGCKIVPGNATVKNLVAKGVCDFGWTDTDDFFVGLDEGHPVAMFPIRIDGQTICLPNSVAMIRGTERRDDAARLIDYLLSEKVELKLARSASRQVPLGPVDKSALPEEVKPLANWARESVDVTQYSKARTQCLNWLQTEALE
jgi:iron(III) transport system substrate-binding protein